MTKIFVLMFYWPRYLLGPATEGLNNSTVGKRTRKTTDIFLGQKNLAKQLISRSPAVQTNRKCQPGFALLSKISHRFCCGSARLPSQSRHDVATLWKIDIYFQIFFSHIFHNFYLSRYFHWLFGSTVVVSSSIMCLGSDKLYDYDF